jgi:hypothetical protein
MGEAAAPARLVTAASGAQRISPRCPGTPFAAVNLAAIALAADQHLSPTAPAQKEPRRRRRVACCVNLASTRPSPLTIIPPHSCPRTVQGHGADATARLGSAPCLSPCRIVLIAPVVDGQAGGETAPPSIPVSGCPGGQTGTPTRAASSLVRALRDARGSPLFATWTTLCPSHAELFRRNHADSHHRRQLRPLRPLRHEIPHGS